MKIVWSWLSEMVSLNETEDSELSPEQAAAVLTRGGLEVEDLEFVGAGIRGVVIAEVVGRRDHPNADKLTLVSVVDKPGGTVTEVVCGAPNVPDVGGRVLWAQPGSLLPGPGFKRGLEIGKRTIKGIESAGMLCSEQELGLGEDHDGIIVLEADEQHAPLGSDPMVSLGLADVVFDIGIPANRADCLGHLGVARELVALVGDMDSGRSLQLVPPTQDLAEFTQAHVDVADLVNVTLSEPERCSRYTARVIDGLTVKRSPRWMRRRLSMVGVRPLSNLVDVTNYVMFECGQPLHAFDLNKLNGNRIEVRCARTGESLITLDGINRTLVETDLLICDQNGPVALAGVMGGRSTEVGANSTQVLLEAAQFAPISVRRTARRLGLRSESSFRYERYVDPNGIDAASARAAYLLAKIGGGRIASGLADAYPSPTSPSTVLLRPSRATAIAGMPFDRATATSLLTREGLKVASVGDDKLEVTIPTSRIDLSREIDLIEELIRLRGFDKVPATLPPLFKSPCGRSLSRSTIARDALIGAGLSEAITFGFTSPEAVAHLGFPDADPRSHPMALRNPMSQRQSVMRTSLLSTLLGAVAHNLKHQLSDIRLFEIGSVFIGTIPSEDGEASQQLPAEPIKVAVVMTGQEEVHLGDRRPLDVFDLKGVLDLLVSALPTHPRPPEAVATSTIPFLHPGLSGELRTQDGQVLGVYGEIHPSVRESFEIDCPVFAFELGLDQFPEVSAKQMAPIPRFPSSSRDLSFWLDRTIPANDVLQAIRQAGMSLLESAEILEDFRDERYVPDGKKGMLWSLTYRSHERTLTDAEVDTAHDQLCRTLLSGLDATRR